MLAACKAEECCLPSKDLHPDESKPGRQEFSPPGQGYCKHLPPFSSDYVHIVTLHFDSTVVPLAFDIVPSSHQTVFLLMFKALVGIILPLFPSSGLHWLLLAPLFLLHYLLLPQISSHIHLFLRFSLVCVFIFYLFFSSFTQFSSPLLSATIQCNSNSPIVDN